MGHCILLVTSCLGVSISAILWPRAIGAQADPEETYRRLRAEMVAEQIAGRGVRDERVLQVMRELPRHLFVPPSRQTEAYADKPLSIGDGQTMPPEEPTDPKDALFYLSKPGAKYYYLWRLFRSKEDAEGYVVQQFKEDEPARAWAASIPVLAYGELLQNAEKEGQT